MCVDIISKYYDSGNIEKACDELLQEAARIRDFQNSVDDITFIVAFFASSND